jgi:FkbM family methyltransferase
MTSRDNGLRLLCPLGDHRVAPLEALNFLDYEKEESAMIIKLAEGARVVIDVGANMGWHSINIAKHYPECQVYALEPIPETYSFLEKNVKINGISNIQLHPVGLSNKREELEFYFYPEGSGNASSRNLSDRADAKLVTCYVEPMDGFVLTKKISVDFVKCDVEGAELLVFQGGRATLERDRPIVFTEMLRKWAAKFGYHPNEIINLFSDLGYACFRLKGEGLFEISSITDDTIETNFFFLHQEKHSEKIKRFRNQ